MHSRNRHAGKVLGVRISEGGDFLRTGLPVNRIPWRRDFTGNLGAGKLCSKQGNHLRSENLALTVLLLVPLPPPLLNPPCKFFRNFT